MTDRDGYLTSGEVWTKQMQELSERPLVLSWHEGYLYINGSAAGYGSKTNVRRRKRAWDRDEI